MLDKKHLKKHFKLTKVKIIIFFNTSTDIYQYHWHRIRSEIGNFILKLFKISLHVLQYQLFHKSPYFDNITSSPVLPVDVLLEFAMQPDLYISLNSQEEKVLFVPERSDINIWQYSSKGLKALCTIITRDLQSWSHNFETFNQIFLSL